MALDFCPLASTGGIERDLHAWGFNGFIAGERASEVSFRFILCKQCRRLVKASFSGALHRKRVDHFN